MKNNLENTVQLVDETDNPNGTIDKLRAHKEGLLHRAVSILIFNSKGEWLLQQRALDKYHSGGLWSNACCTHPYVGESECDAIHRRLNQEMGIKLDCDIELIDSFIYKAKMNDNLTEFEYDHLFAGVTDIIPQPEKSEVMAWKYISSKELKKEIEENPGDFTEWFKIIISKVFE